MFQALRRRAGCTLRTSRNIAFMFRNKYFKHRWLRRKLRRSLLLRPRMRRSLYVLQTTTRRVGARIDLCHARKDQALPIPVHQTVPRPVSAELLCFLAMLGQDLALSYPHHQRQARTRQSVTFHYTVKIFEDNVNVLEYRQQLCSTARMAGNVMCRCEKKN